MAISAKIDENFEVTTIDAALTQTHFGRFNYLLIVFSGLVLINVVLESVGVSFVLPILDCDFQLSHQQQGVLGAVAFVGIIVSSHLWGFLADTTGRKCIMRPALLGGFVVTLISSFAPNFETLAVLRFFSGVLLSASSATIFAYLGEFHAQKRRNRAILSAALMSAVSAIFFPIIAWIFINQRWSFAVPLININFKPWRSYIVACGVPGFICFLLLHFRLPESPKYLLTMRRQSEALAVLRDIHRRNVCANTKLKLSKFKVTRVLPDPADTHTTIVEPLHTDDGSKRNLFRSMWLQTAPLFQRQHIHKTLLASVIQFILFFSAHGVYMWFPYILNSSMKFTQIYGDQHNTLCEILQIMNTINGTVAESYGGTTTEELCVTHLEISTYQHTIILELIYVTLLLCVSYGIGKLGRKLILFTILIVCGICGIASLIIETPLLAIYLFVILLCCGLGTTVVNAIVVDMYPTHLRAMAVCISLMLGRIGSVTGSSVLGALIDTQCQLALYAAAGSMLLAAVFGFMLPKTDQQKNDRTAQIKCIEQEMESGKPDT